MTIAYVGERRYRTRTDQSVEIARGILLLGVFHIHVLHWLVDHLADAGAGRLAGLQIKLLTPHVVLFFALSGLTSTALADKTFAIVAQRSLMLVLIAASSHVIGVAIQLALWRPWRDGIDPWTELLRPIVLGTGYANVIGWFFVVLAVVRVLAFVLSLGALLFELPSLLESAPFEEF